MDVADAAQLRHHPTIWRTKAVWCAWRSTADCLKALRDTTGIQYEGRQGGTLQLFRTAKQYENATRDIAVLEDAGVPYQLLEAKRLAEVEPALAEVSHRLTGPASAK